MRNIDPREAHIDGGPGSYRRWPRPISDGGPGPVASRDITDTGLGDESLGPRGLMSFNPYPSKIWIFKKLQWIWVFFLTSGLLTTWRPMRMTVPRHDLSNLWWFFFFSSIFWFCIDLRGPVTSGSQRSSKSLEWQMLKQKYAWFPVGRQLYIGRQWPVLDVSLL